MKKIITSVAALILIGSVAFAQDAKKAEKKPAKKTEAKADSKMAPAKADSKMAPAKADKKMDAKKK